MGDIDRDIFGPASRVRYVRKSAWKDPGLVPADADDCAPGLETEPTPPKPAVARRPAPHDADRDWHGPTWVRPVRELNDSGDFAAWLVAGPSPGDDITREAFDAMDGQS